MPCEDGNKHYGCVGQDCFGKVSEKAIPGLFEDFYDSTITAIITMNFINAFYDVAPGTVISEDRDAGCSLKKYLDAQKNL